VPAKAAEDEKPVGMVKVKLTTDMNVEVTLEQVKSVLCGFLAGFDEYEVVFL
jgi:hypothetical protein